MNKSPWIETFTGKKFHLLNPQPEEICIEDIAHALSMIVRFSGHAKEFYSVAEHSVHVSTIVSSRDALWGLLHDASEAYISDISRPLKHLTPVGAPYRKIEARIMKAISLRFSLVLPIPESVVRVDNLMLWAEKEALMSPLSWDDMPGVIAPSRHGRSQTIRLDFYGPKFAEKSFLSRYKDLVARPR